MMTEQSVAESGQDNRDQIIRLDARACFLEVKNDCFHLDKVHLQFVTYDQTKPKGQRYTNNINIYVDLPEFLVLAQEATTGALHARMQQYKQAKKQEPLFECLGGTSAEQLAFYGRPRPDGKSLSRVAKLVWADRADYLFVADSGPGEQNEKGLIVPRFGKNPEHHVAVSLSWRQVNQLMAKTTAHYNAWLSAKYMAEWAELHAPRLVKRPRSDKAQPQKAAPPRRPAQQQAGNAAAPYPSQQHPPAPAPAPQQPASHPAASFAGAFGSISGMGDGKAGADDTRMF